MIEGEIIIYTFEQVLTIRNSLYIQGINLETMVPGSSVQDHYHGIFELFCCYRGKVTQTIKDKTYTMNAGDWLFIKCGERHNLANLSDENLEYFVFHFDIDDPELRKLLNHSGMEYMPEYLLKDSKLPYLADEIHAVAKGMGLFGYNSSKDLSPTQIIPYHTLLMIEGHILMIISEYLKLLENNPVHQNTVEKTMSSLDIQNANKIAEKLEQIAFNPLSIQKICQEMGISRSQASKTFTRLYGLSPKQYLNTLKLKRIKELLVNSELSIEEISETVGFSSVSHFSRQFKRWVGISPMKFRPQKNIP